MPPQKSDGVWIESLELFTSDREVLLSPTGWLTSGIIDAAQLLLKQQFPNISGFERTELGYFANFSAHKSASTLSFIQVIHDTNHWVVAHQY